MHSLPVGFFLLFEGTKEILKIPYSGVGATVKIGRYRLWSWFIESAGDKMKLHVLVDNNTLIDRYYLAEPGFSVLIEDEDVRLLFDTGYSDIFIRNGQKMGLDLTHLDYVALSHSHLDHTWGLEPLIRYYSELKTAGISCSKPTLIAHSQAFISVVEENFGEFGSLISKEKLAKHFQMELTDQPMWLSDRVVFLGQIPRKNDFESIISFGKKEGSDEPDWVIEDSALAYKSGDGLVVVTGCSHAGICNIIEYAKTVCSEDRISDVIGGLHLQNPSERQLQGTCHYFKELNLKRIHACHCTDLKSKIELSKVVDVQEVGVGLSLTYSKYEKI
jgi:7,8-dihydropterin-6-yl-methyl-4-(beta-D-ribofuranosyl)aminobenzene 5'-phosphate synthase